jgi:catalase
MTTLPQADTKQNGDLFKNYAEDKNATSDDVVYTTSGGAPYPHPYETQRAGNNGPLLLQDFHLIDLLSHFDRERVPERVVHAKGSAAHGYYKTTNSLEDLSVADLFQSGKTCPITIRFSTVGGEKGTPDLRRDPRGFSVKFRTEEGNWDMVANNTPVFFLRDPAKFPHFIHTQKRNPQTNLAHEDDATYFWDYFSQNPESIHQVMVLFGDRGIPDGFRFQHGYSGHSFKLINKSGEWVYVQFHFRSKAGFKTMTGEEAASKSPDYSQQDLFEAIEKGDYPEWDVLVQTMTPTQAEEAWEKDGINVLDLTHVWPQGKYPLRKVGEFVLNENVKNYFAEVEQIAFSPSHLVPGIEPSADPVLQSRLFSYPDTHRHRIGTNYQQLPVNQPRVPYKFGNFQRDGAMSFYSQGSRPGYLSSLEPIQLKKRKVNLDTTHNEFVGRAISFLTEIRPEDFVAPRNLWTKVFDEGARERFVENVSGHWEGIQHNKEEIVKRQIAIFREVCDDVADRLEKASGIKGYPGISELQFNGTHNGMAKDAKLKGANGRPDDYKSVSNGAPGSGIHQHTNGASGTNGTNGANKSQGTSITDVLKGLA